MKICVYAICKNEEQFVDRWMDSVDEADAVYVLDTGSSDKTVEKLKRRGAIVSQKIISPWRFDTARNESLKLVPEDADLCVCIDLDEIFEKGWRKILEREFSPEIKRFYYRYTWSFNPDGTEGIVFWTDKIHVRQGFFWKHPVHEVLVYNGTETLFTKTIPLQLNHYPDSNKSRGQYLPLLELSVKEDPDDDRNMHYLGREYMFRGEWDKCIKTLKKHLNLPSATWGDERCASMRYIAKAYFRLEKNAEAERWYLRAIAEAPHLREPFIDAERFYYGNNDWIGVVYMGEKALKIKQRSMTYINEPVCWSSLPYDLMSIAYYNLNILDKALFYAQKAAELSPKDKRIMGNIQLIKEKLNKG